MPCYANYNYISWLANQVSEKGSAKPHAKSIDFTSRTSCQYAGREGLLSWTMITVTGNYTYPEQTPWRPSQSNRSRDVCHGGAALSGPDELGAEYLYAPRHCSSDILSLLSRPPCEGDLEVIENEAAPARLPLVTASLLLGQPGFDLGLRYPRLP